MANVKISQLPIGVPTSTSIFPFVDGVTTYQGAISALTSNSTVEVTYSELVDYITSETLNTGSFYIITDFRTCYDQPDYNNEQDEITSGIYKSADTVSPIVVLATSANTISIDAFQPEFPFDKIKYDYSFNATEHTEGPAFGRITERIDNFNNRTDYDHRTILFKRYRGYSYEENNPLAGLIGISGITGTTGVLYGNTGTTFNSDISSGSIIAIPNLNPSFFEVISVESDSLAIISGVTISGTDSAPYYSTSDDGIMSYYQPNIRQNEVYEYTTFGDVIGETGAVNNYIGDQANLYLDNGNGEFLLANNVFLDGSFRNNTIGNGSYNNTFNDDCDNNQIGDSFYNNSTNDDFDGNIIGNNFNNNYITANFNDNRIGSNFYYNVLLGGSFYRNNIGNDFRDNIYTSGDFQNNEIGNQFNNNKIYDDFYNNDIGNGYNNNESYSQFYRNLIGNGYNNNTVYSEFYDNNIEHVFGNNTIGDDLNIGNYNFSENKIGNYFQDNSIGNYNFSENKIGNYFYDNEIAYDFDNNDIGNNFNNNEIRRWFRDNTIKNDFTDNTTNGYENSNNDEQIGFEGNSIGNGFSQNEISYTFKDNIIGNNFNNNITGRRFEDNNIGNNFNNNKPFNSQLFGWYNLSNLSDRTFRTFYISLDQAVGQYVVGTEMVMRIISTGQYFKIIFTQWTQGNNGGGFSYNRQEIDSNGNDIGNTVYFTKTNGGDEVDVIVEGVVEITRGNNNVIYNAAVEADADNDVSPEDTEWNSIFTETNEVFAFEKNLIQNNFQNNSFDGDFDDNTVGNDFSQNDIHGNFYYNTVGNDYAGNNIYIEFNNNSIGNDFDDNTINIDFYSNKIGNDFQNNTTMLIFNGNTIGDSFGTNLIDSQLSGWNNLSNVASRNYEVWRDSLNGNVGNYILDRELVMRIISTGQYFKIIFTQWTQGYGGGFSYNRTEIDSSGNDIGPEVSFTKENNSNDVDVIVEGVVEITRGNNGGIYNIATEGSYNQNTSPADTEWNSIFSSQNEDNNFTSNIIGNNFNNNNITTQNFYKNEIGTGFYDNDISGATYNNRIGEQFEENTIYDSFYDNQIFNEFKGNMIYEGFYENRTDWGFGGNQISGFCAGNIFGTTISSNDFLGSVYGNTFKGGVLGNTIGDNFSSNNIGFGFISNIIGENFGNGGGDPQGNTIGNYFNDNTIGEYFYNNTIADNFRDNEVGNYFQWNVINTNIDNTYFTLNYGNITGFSYIATGTTATDDLYSGIQICGATQSVGTEASFNIEVSGGTVIGVTGATEGRLYQNDDELTILGIQIGGTTPEDNIVITVTGTTSGSSFYQHYTKQIFERRLGNKRVSFYDEDDILNVDSVYEISGYIPVYSQSLSFPFSSASFEFECDGSYTNNGGITNQSASTMTELVTVFNNNFRQFGYFFDNNDGTIGLYINPSLKQQYCPSGAYTINVFND